MQIVLLGGGLFWKGEIKVINVTCLVVFDNAKKTFRMKCLNVFNVFEEDNT